VVKPTRCSMAGLLIGPDIVRLAECRLAEGRTGSNLSKSASSPLVRSKMLATKQDPNPCSRVAFFRSAHTERPSRSGARSATAEG
jgi:hypothetical protein